MARPLLSLNLSEIQKVVLEMELGKEVLQGLTKTNLVFLVRDHLPACVSDPLKDDFDVVEFTPIEPLNKSSQSSPLGVTQTQPFQLSGLNVATVGLHGLTTFNLRLAVWWPVSRTQSCTPSPLCWAGSAIMEEVFNG
ncbi:unnamed protein product [Lepeophtheirus salmonis]|uniref:(salmon louse) hypothetical protein n=1 Tax=Lepeophtheirus salmonis TaxID=72036 RepID=A0A817FAN9_LEPSM|nr:unnamed protein product [Lepeophtheirus salmonis]